MALLGPQLSAVFCLGPVSLQGSELKEHVQKMRLVKGLEKMTSEQRLRESRWSHLGKWKLRGSSSLYHCLTGCCSEERPSLFSGDE